ncbi:hypothetical protein P7G31_09890 [Streptococcus parauberis]|uniref:Lipoprotein n=2 Tax=Streptococcus TaxID=1301 RepID=A0AAE4KV65_9STRE|nr:hypothetical protein [Streptococcus parauberis]MDT2732526.1 hypothetical protein [Streptococcus parauberis]
MFDTQKIKILKIVGYVLVVILACTIGVGIGQGTSNNANKAKTEKSTSTNSKSIITQKQVKSFLLNYYTKKDLGENRQRYKEYMTDALYNQTVSMENEPQSQTYKGFVVDFEFKDAEIYIDEAHKQVIVQVDYVNTQLDEKKNYKTAQKDVMNKATQRLTYVDEKSKLKVNKMESIILTDSTEDYGTLDSSSSTETETSQEIKDSTKASSNP